MHWLNCSRKCKGFGPALKLARAESMPQLHIYIIYPVHMSNFRGLEARDFWFQLLHHNQFCNYDDIKKLAMMQQLELRKEGLKFSKIGHADRVIVFFLHPLPHI